MARRYWLFKSEPDVYPFDRLAADGTTFWEGVRNYQARNFLRDDVAVGDEVLFYHSRQQPMAVVGTATVTRAALPDPSQFDRHSKYYDDKATLAAPRWFGVEIRHASKFASQVPLATIKATAGLENMVLVGRGRLSVQPVSAKEFRIICRLGSAA
jgi:predicted RNA-binding protein with PUA-like domain